MRKQNECLMIQQGHTILVLECKTWKIQFLCWDICLWMHCTVLIDCTEPIGFVCAHFNQYSHSPSFDCIHHLRLYSSSSCGSALPFLDAGFARIPPAFFNSQAVWIKYSLTSNSFDVYSRDHLSGISASIWIFSGYEGVFNFSIIASCSRSNSAAFHCAHVPQKHSQRCTVHPCPIFHNFVLFPLGACSTTVLRYTM